MSATTYANTPWLQYDVFAHHGRNLIEDFHSKSEGGLPSSPPIARGLKSLSIPTSSIHKSDEVAPVGILGAGAGGLYTALILQDLGIPYRIIEARPEVGGRLFTYTFPNTTGAPYNYYDVGAMRFPKIDAMRRVFKLFHYPPLNPGDKSDLEKKLQPFYFTSTPVNNALYFYNGIRVVQCERTPQDTFKADEVILDTDPKPYITAGTKAITDDVINPFATRLLDDLKNGTSDGWTYMQSFDKYSTRAFMSLHYKPSPSLGLPDKCLPTDVVNWCETFDKSTGWYDRALSETVLEAVAFGWQPGPNPPSTDWYCIDGGVQEIAKSMAKYVIGCNPLAITFNSKVTSIALAQDNNGVEVITDHSKLHQFSHVISTLPLPVLRTIDLRKADLSPMQSNALRELTYGPSVKIGMQFKTAWWTTGVDRTGKPLNIVGGQSYTDRPLRTIVYPSFGDVKNGKTTTLIASYCWTDDATRMGALVGSDDATMVNMVLNDIADIHNVDVAFLREQLISYMGWDWAHDPLTMGAFAFFGPGKFEDVYISLNSPAAGGFLHFAGEALSVRHAWVEGALDSAWRAVAEMLLFPAFNKYQEKFYKDWGMNPEWLKSSNTYNKGKIPKVEDSLLLAHMAVTRPEMF
ncbi:amine oxidase [Rickenella mellea]|uniref:Amine oxidase n=1 Tax=Rickenella mellea TaxID=50990 RepID=A0A4Y7PGY9_9AGAM|nr:amine oxidase [Rickenella mellea]